MKGQARRHRRRATRPSRAGTEPSRAVVWWIKSGTGLRPDSLGGASGPTLRPGWSASSARETRHRWRGPPLAHQGRVRQRVSSWGESQEVCGPCLEAGCSPFIWVARFGELSSCRVHRAVAGRLARVVDGRVAVFGHYRSLLEWLVCIERGERRSVPADVVLAPSQFFPCLAPSPTLRALPACSGGGGVWASRPMGRFAALTVRLCPIFRAAALYVPKTLCPVPRPPPIDGRLNRPGLAHSGFGFLHPFHVVAFWFPLAGVVPSALIQPSSSRHSSSKYQPSA